MDDTTLPHHRVLFVCMGNICRSPAGEGVFRHLVETHGWSSRFQIDSAGTIGYHAGKPADARMRAAALKRGYDLQSISRKATRDDLENFDLVLAMDRENLADLKRLHQQPESRIELLSAFLDDRWPDDVPDPYYGGDAGFEYVLDMIEAACPAILDALVRPAAESDPVG